MLKERQLIKAAVKGDVGAFEQLIKTYEQKIYGLCLHLLKDPQDAYDASQEVCIKVWKQLQYFEGHSQLGTWIYRITTNQCLDEMRKKSKQKNVISISAPQGDGDKEWEMEIKDEKVSIEKEIEDEELRKVIYEAIAGLKDEYQIILTLRDIEGHSYETIGEILELSPGTVKSRLSRARQALKKILMQDKEPYRTFFRHIK